MVRKSEAHKLPLDSCQTLYKQYSLSRAPPNQQNKLLQSNRMSPPKDPTKDRPGKFSPEVQARYYSQISLTSLSNVKISPPSHNPVNKPISTYGILILYVPSTFDTTNQTRAIASLTSKNAGFIPGLEITSVEWLIPEWTKTKHYGSLLVEITKPESANAAIREQLLVGNKVLACEYFERKSRQRQCFFCQHYGHSEEQCQASVPSCGHCAEPHATSSCKSKQDARRCKCAVCGERHSAWDNICSIRQAELDRVRKARANKPKYHTTHDNKIPNFEGLPEWEVPSREYAGTQRYSPAFMLEIRERDGRKSHAKFRGRGGRGEGLPPNFDEAEERIEAERGLRPAGYFTGKPDPVDPKGRIWGLDGKAPFDSNKYNNRASFRRRLEDMGIDPYLPGQKAKSDIDEDQGGTREVSKGSASRLGWGTPVHSSGLTQLDGLGKLGQRPRPSPIDSTKDAAVVSDKRKALARIRAADTWR